MMVFNSYVLYCIIFKYVVKYVVKHVVSGVVNACGTLICCKRRLEFVGTIGCVLGSGILEYVQCTLKCDRSFD